MNQQDHTPSPAFPAAERAPDIPHDQEHRTGPKRSKKRGNTTPRQAIHAFCVECQGSAITAKPAGDLIVAEKWVREVIVKRGVVPEKVNPADRVCSIGFCKREQYWYGWTESALFCYSIGSNCVKGDPHHNLVRGEWKAKTLDDARQMACDFVEGMREIQSRVK